MLGDPMPFIPRDPAFDGLRRVWDKYRRYGKTAPPGPSLGQGRGSVATEAEEGRSEAIGPICGQVDETQKGRRS